MVQADVLKSIDDPELHAYAVWEPILRTDDERAARRATVLMQDSRVEHIWTPNQALGGAFQAPIGLKGEPAWDVYLVYPKGVRWDGESPPKPAYFMHQLRGRLPEDLMLDGNRLAERISIELQSR